MNVLLVLTILSILACSITCFVSLDYLQMASNIQLPRKKYVCLLIISSILVGYISLFSFPIFKTGAVMILCIMLGKFVFHHKQRQLIHDFCFAILISMIDYIIVPIFVYLFWNYEITMYINLFLNGLFMLLAQLLLLYIYHIFRKVYYHDNYDAPLGLRIISFICMPIYSVGNIIMLISMSQFQLHFEMLIVYIGNIIFIVFLNLYQFYAIHTMSLNSYLREEVALYEQKNAIQLTYYEQLEANYQHSRKIIHDTKRHLQAIVGAKEQQLSIDDYKEDLEKMMDEYAMPILSTHRILNIILNDKQQVAQKANINFRCVLPPLPLDFIKDIDITTIFANLLDNAIDACELCKEDRWISVYGDKIQDFLVVSIENGISTTTGNTKKKVKQHEGIGLNNVERSLSKYGGNMQVSMKDEKFVVSLYIPVM